MKKLIATIGIVSALGIGAFALNTVMPASAVTGSATQTSSSSDPTTGPACPAPRARFKNVLDKLVGNGTIDQSQEDAIIQAFKDEAANNPGPGRFGRKVRGAAGRILQGAIDTAANAMNMSADDLKAELKTGKSIADVANEHSVDPATVAKAIVDAATTKIDEAVTNGKLSQTQAGKVKTHLPAAVDKLVNHTPKPRDC